MSYMCKRHGVKMEKTRSFEGEVFYKCPKDKCGFRRDENGEKI